MHRRIPVTFIVMAVLMLVLGAICPTIAGDSPLKLTGTVTLLGDPFATGGAPFTATGNASHLGKFTGGGQVAFTVEGSTFISQGTLTLQAANGDLLYTSFRATGDATTEVRTGPLVIRGGTGRFQNAQGQGTISARPLGGNQVAITADAVSITDFAARLLTGVPTTWILIARLIWHARKWQDEYLSIGRI